MRLAVLAAAVARTRPAFTVAGTLPGTAAVSTTVTGGTS
jgi:hypothetical protein